jgi:hypothetical protein
VAVVGALSSVAMLDMSIVSVVPADFSEGLHVPSATAQWRRWGVNSRSPPCCCRSADGWTARARGPRCRRPTAGFA